MFFYQLNFNIVHAQNLGITYINNIPSNLKNIEHFYGFEILPQKTVTIHFYQKSREFSALHKPCVLYDYQYLLLYVTHFTQLLYTFLCCTVKTKYCVV